MASSDSAISLASGSMLSFLNSTLSLALVGIFHLPRRRWFGLFMERMITSDDVAPENLPRPKYEHTIVNHGSSTRSSCLAASA